VFRSTQAAAVISYPTINGIFLELLFTVFTELLLMLIIVFMVPLLVALLVLLGIHLGNHSFKNSFCFTLWKVRHVVVLWCDLDQPTNFTQKCKMLSRGFIYRTHVTVEQTLKSNFFHKAHSRELAFIQTLYFTYKVKYLMFNKQTQ